MSEGTKRKTGLAANAVKHAKPREKAYKLSDRESTLHSYARASFCHSGRG